ncbi:MAG TPA: hypothetical protein VGW12_09535 [Pyrinomonadaceae bacterium]|nr:hypothetical protein [Pyrinomonadaceae bacterium]
MSRLLRSHRSVVAIACCCFVLMLSAMALAYNSRTANRRSHASGNEDKKDIARQVEAAPDQTLRIAGNDDCPLKLVEARVKEVSGRLFTKLTGKATNLASVSTVPEATLVNKSGQTVTRFFLAIRDPQTRSARGILQSRVALKPGETYKITRDHFAEPEKMTLRGEDGKFHQKLVVPGLESEKKWLSLAERSSLFITVAMIDFADGSRWTLPEEGEFR